MSPKTKNYLIVLLALSTVTGAALAWQQSRRLNDLEAKLAAAPRPSLAAATPRPVRPAQAAPASEAAPAEAAEGAPVEPAANQNQNRARRAPGGGLQALMSNPEAVKAFTIQQKAQLDRRYADLFKKLNLPADQLDKLKTLMVEHEAAGMDVMAAARAQGLNPRENRDEIQKLTEAARAEVDANIKSALGDAGYAAYTNYNQTTSQRNLVSQIEQRLSYSSSPLNAAQSEQLVNTLASLTANTAATGNQNNFGGGFGGFGGGGGNTPQVTDQVIAQAQSILSPNQLEALRQIQSEQQAQQKLRDLVRAAEQANETGAAGGANAGGNNNGGGRQRRGNGGGGGG